MNRLQKVCKYGKNVCRKLILKAMVKKHTIRKETNIDAATGDINIVEEHVIIEKHDFLHAEDEEEEDLYFLGKKEKEEEDDDGPSLFIINNDDNFW
jgi:hypothetical protein